MSSLFQSSTSNLHSSSPLSHSGDERLKLDGEVAVEKVRIDRLADLERIVQGGSEYGDFLTYVDNRVSTPQSTTPDQAVKGCLPIIRFNNVDVCGWTRYEFLGYIKSLTLSDHEDLSIEIVKGISSNLREYLSLSHDEESSFEGRLQRNVRDNLYKRTTPCTTRPRKEIETDGKDYIFLSEEEFRKADRDGIMIETGNYQGFMYGTPKPGAFRERSIRVQEHLNGKGLLSCLMNGSCADCRSTNEFITGSLIKRNSGFGFTIVGGRSASSREACEFLEIRTIMPGGPADKCGRFQAGDILMYINDICILGYSHLKVVELFRSINVGEKAEITVCRGHSSIGQNGCNGQTVHVDRDIAKSTSISPVPSSNQQRHKLQIQKGMSGFGFTLVDCGMDLFTTPSSGDGGGNYSSRCGQRVKQIFDMSRCDQLRVGDRIVSINGMGTMHLTHQAVVDILKSCPPNGVCNLEILRDSTPSGLLNRNNALVKLGNIQEDVYASSNEDDPDTLQGRRISPIVASVPKPTTMHLCTTLRLGLNDEGFGFRVTGGREEGTQASIGYIVPGGPAYLDGVIKLNDKISEIDGVEVSGASHKFVVDLILKSRKRRKLSMRLQRVCSNEEEYIGGKGVLSSDRLIDDSFNNGNPSTINDEDDPTSFFTCTLTKDGPSQSFGFVIVSSNNDDCPKIGRILDNSAASVSDKLSLGDRILSINGISICGRAHQDIVELIKRAGNSITLEVVRCANKGGMMLSSGSPRSADLGFTKIADITVRNSTGLSNSANARFPSTYTPAGHSTSALDNILIASHDYLDTRTYRSTGSFRGGTCMHNSSIKREVDPAQYDHLMPLDNPVEALSNNPVVSAVKLKRLRTGFGFSVRGGSEYQMSLFILKIASGGAADQSGLLKSGDEILEINGRDARAMSHRDAIELIKNGGDYISLIVRHTGRQPPSLEDVHFAISRSHEGVSSNNSSLRRSRTPMI